MPVMSDRWIRRMARDHGMIDLVVHRHKLRETIARLCRLLGGATGEHETLPALLEPVEA